MAKFVCSIELDSPIMVSNIAKRPLSVDLEKLPNVARAELLRYGVQRKFNDGTGGADTSADDKFAAGSARLEAFYRGEIKAARSAGTSELVRVSRRIAESAFIAAKGKDHAEVKALDDMADDDWAEKMDAILEKNGAKLQPAIDAELARLAADRAAKATVKAAQVGFDLDL